MKLYHSPGACSMAVHIALRETGLPFEAIAVDLAKHRTADGRDYYEIAPRGYVPLLELDDGSRHTEVAALLQYVADRDPAQALIGAVGTPRRLAVTEWLAFTASELHKGFSPLWNPATPEATKAAALERLKSRLADVDAHLATHDFVAGAYSVADSYVFTVVNWANFLQMPLDGWPNLEAFMARVGARPAVQATLKAEGLAG